MNTIADFPAVMKFAGGANVNKTLGIPWTTLVPKKLTVAGRIDQQKAIEYLCGLRYSDATDIVVLSVTPADDAGRPGFAALVDYFVSKKRYGVVGDKGVGNVRDTYLVPVLPGKDNIPEFMLNIEDNLVPKARDEPMLLVVFVYKGERPSVGPDGQLAAAGGTPTPAQAFAHRQSISGPAFSPTSPQGPFSTPTPSRTGLPHHTPVPGQNGQTGQALPHHAAQQQQQHSVADMQHFHVQGWKIASEALGQFVNCPTVQFLLPQAFMMSKREWEIIRDIFEKDPKARDDLQHLSTLLEKHSTVV